MYKQLKKALWLAAGLYTWQLQAIIMPKEARTQLRLGYGLIHQEGSDRRYTLRPSFEVGYRDHVYENIFYDISLGLAPDLTKQSELVNIKENIYELHAYAEYRWVYLFAYYLGFGPSGSWSTIKYQIREQAFEKNIFGTSFDLVSAVDYAINPNWELSLGLNIRVFYLRDIIDYTVRAGTNFNL